MTAAVAQLAAWKASAHPGDRFEYHRGFLASDYDLDFDGLCARDAIRAEAARLYVTGEYELAQVRVGDNAGSTFAYFIIKRRKRDPERRVWKKRSDTEIFRAGHPHHRRRAA